jgi:hypothetical protein
MLTLVLSVVGLAVLVVVGLAVWHQYEANKLANTSGAPTLTSTVSEVEKAVETVASDVKTDVSNVVSSVTATTNGGSTTTKVVSQ